VAAVCYRIRGTEIEFLLVRTRKGRWTFPKGGLESGLTHAQAAALEAFEEAGVHGRIEEASLARYRRKKRANGKESAAETLVHAYLCEVLRLGPPQELHRNRTWFSPHQAKAQLRGERDPENGAELARVVDCAVSRIQRVRSPVRASADPLQKVHFEAAEANGSGHGTRNPSSGALVAKRRPYLVIGNGLALLQDRSRDRHRRNYRRLSPENRVT
jgi:8-oxo-dGTP pyrophosphatase MutT (NUDIX family)